MNDRRVAAWLFLFLLGVQLFTAGGHCYSSDEETLLATALQLSRGTLAIPADAEQRMVLALAGGNDGKLYGQYPPGQPLLALPWVLAGQWLMRLLPSVPPLYLLHLAVTTFNQFVVALLGVVLFLFGRDLGWTRRRALGIALVAMFTSPLWQYGKTFFSEPLLALLALAAAWQLRRGHGWRAGFLLAYAPLVKYAAVLWYPPLLLYAWLLRRSWQDLFRLLVPLLLALLVIAALNQSRFGSPLASGYHHNRDTGFANVPWVGWVGLTVSPGRGLLWYWPPVLLALAALPAAWRAARAEAALAASALLLHVAFYGAWYTWAGEQSWGPRYLVPCLPLVVVLCGWWYAWRRPAALVLVVAGLLVQVAGVSIYFNSHYAITSGTLPAAQLRMGPYYFHDFHYVPGMSPIVGHWRLLPRRVWEALRLLANAEVVATNAALPDDPAWVHYASGGRPAESLSGLFVPPLPERITPFYSWFFVPTLDFAWCYWRLTVDRTTGWALLWLLPLLPAAAAARQLWEASA